MRSARMALHHGLVRVGVLLAVTSGAHSTLSAQLSGSAHGPMGSRAFAQAEIAPRNALSFPTGTQTFDGRENLRLFDPVDSIPGWSTGGSPLRLQAWIGADPRSPA